MESHILSLTVSFKYYLYYFDLLWAMFAKCFSRDGKSVPIILGDEPGDREGLGLRRKRWLGGMTRGCLI